MQIPIELIKQIIYIEPDSEDREILINSLRVQIAVNIFLDEYSKIKSSDTVKAANITEFKSTAKFFNENKIAVPLVFCAEKYPYRQTELAGGVYAMIVRFGIERELKKLGYTNVKAEVKPFLDDMGEADGAVIEIGIDCD